MSDPLNGAYARLRRTDEHLGDLKTLCTVFIHDYYELAAKAVQLNPEPGIPFDLTRPESPIPMRAAILTGEMIYNLRASLDYLVYELAILDSGVEQLRTQFPITDSTAEFKEERKSRLKGVSDSHVEWIELLQPYNGVEWTRRLREISNPDKHKHLIITDTNTELDARTSNDRADIAIPDDIKGLFVNAKNVNSEGPAYIQFHLTFFIAFDDGLPVLETLEEIKRQVAQVLNNFRPEFKV
jgi:hypothetical protein